MPLKCSDITETESKDIYIKKDIMKIRLTESNLNKIIRNIVSNVLNEEEETHKSGSNRVRNRTSRYIRRIKSGDCDHRLKKYGTDWVLDLENIDNDAVLKVAKDRYDEIKDLPGKGSFSNDYSISPDSWDLDND